MKKKCEHLNADGWHLPTPEAREFMRVAGERPYGWRDQLRAEFAGEISRWMWPGLLLLLLVGMLLKDWLLMMAAVAALCFFLYQAGSLVRTLRAGRAVTARCHKLVRPDGHGEGEGDDEDLWCGRVRIDEVWQDVLLACPHSVEFLQEGKALELMVVVDPEDHENNWLIGYRRPAE